MFRFKGTSGQDFVQNYDYIISSEDNKRQIRPWDRWQIEWGSIVKKGKVIVMSAVVKKVHLLKSAKLQKTTCPECYRRELGVMPDDSWFQWYASFYAWAAIP